MNIFKLLTFRVLIASLTVASFLQGEEAVKWTEFSFILKPSPLGGIGVFATHDIPVGTFLFDNTGLDDLRKMKVKDIPAEFLKYCIYLNEEECFCPKQFDHMEIGWFINHSTDPNIGPVNNTPLIGNNQTRKIYAIKNIKAGDEIFVDYNYLGEPEDMKENYYKNK